MSVLVSNGSLVPTSRRLQGYDIVRVLVGAVLLVAAGMKGYELATGPVAEKGLLTSRWFLIGVVEFELTLGLLLISGLWKRLAWFLAVASFAVFACVTAYKAWQGEASCGCFGKVEVDPHYTLILDLMLLAAMIAWRPRSACPRVSRGRVAVVLSAAMGVGIPGAVVMASVQTAIIAKDGAILGNSRFVVLEPQKWIGKRFPLLAHIDIGEQLSQGNWIVVLYDIRCSHCRAVMPTYLRMAQRWSEQPDSPRLALVEIPKRPLQPNVQGAPSTSTDCNWGRLSSATEWFAQTPVEIQMSGGTVTYATNRGEGLEWLTQR